ncbi:hypothetical protein [Saguinine gammaherpesvirus 1]|uniref:Uncharacterized protein n=1 Tax=Saguinine gammaherpesvirus 1 TaxID=2169901 RepID=A0A9Q8VHF0_9GAMA|nr:hypothetical protein [Saguinine gammaherpesvirus 1]
MFFLILTRRRRVSLEGPVQLFLVFSFLQFFLAFPFCDFFCLLCPPLPGIPCPRGEAFLLFLVFPFTFFLAFGFCDFFGLWVLFFFWSLGFLLFLVFLECSFYSFFGLSLLLFFCDFFTTSQPYLPKALFTYLQVQSDD